jgi:hypothetical protein
LKYQTRTLYSLDRFLELLSIVSKDRTKKPSKLNHLGTVSLDLFGALAASVISVCDRIPTHCTNYPLFKGHRYQCPQEFSQQMSPNWQNRSDSFKATIALYQTQDQTFDKWLNNLYNFLSLSRHYRQNGLAWNSKRIFSRSIALPHHG